MAALSNNQTEVATSHNQNTAASQSLTSTTASHRLAPAFGDSTAHHEHDEVESSDELVPNDDADRESGNERDNESEADDDSILPQARAKRNSKKSHHNPHPHHLGFYSGTWYDVLVEAKFKYRLFIHTENPFPERNSNSLRDAHDCLLETITKFKDDGIHLDEGTVNQLLMYTIFTNKITAVYNTHRSDMTSLVRSVILILQYI